MEKYLKEKTKLSRVLFVILFMIFFSSILEYGTVDRDFDDIIKIYIIFYGFCAWLLGYCIFDINRTKKIFNLYYESLSSEQKENLTNEFEEYECTYKGFYFLEDFFVYYFDKSLIIIPYSEIRSVRGRMASNSLGLSGTIYIETKQNKTIPVGFNSFSGVNRRTINDVLDIFEQHIAT